MSMHSYGLAAQRIGKFKGAIMAHAIPGEMLAKHGRPITRTLPMNEGDTYVGRRFLPYGATTTNYNSINRFFADGTGDRSATVIQAHQVNEGITPDPDHLTPQDVQVVIAEYACLYGYTNRTADLYEDDIPAQMKIQIGERTTFVREQVLYGALKACTNVYYGGAGTSIGTVDGAISINLLRRVTRNLKANHAKEVNKILKASANFNTEPVGSGWFVFCHSDVEQDIRDLPNFTPVEKYASGTPVPGEIGKCENFRFVMHPDLPSRQDAGAAVGTTGLYSTSASNIDVYQIIVIAQDAWSQLVLRGKNSIEPTFLPVGQKSKSDPFGQRGYAGAKWWQAAFIENNGWMAVINVGVKSLTS